MFGFGEEQPALDKNPQHICDDTENERNLRGEPTGNRQSQQKRQDRQDHTENESDHPQLCGVFTGNTKAHFSRQIVVERMRTLKQSNLADEAKTRCRFRRRNGSERRGPIAPNHLGDQRQEDEQTRQHLLDQPISTHEGACEQKPTG